MKKPLSLLLLFTCFPVYAESFALTCTYSHRMETDVKELERRTWGHFGTFFLDVSLVGDKVAIKRAGVLIGDECNDFEGRAQEDRINAYCGQYKDEYGQPSAKVMLVINRYSGEFTEMFDKQPNLMHAGICKKKERKF